LKTNKSVPEIRQGKIRWTLAVAVSVAAIFAFIFIPAITTNPTSEQLFTMNFEIAPNRLNQIARGSISKQISAPAYQAYDQGDYWQAAQLFEKTMDESAYRLTDLFYLGNCYLALGEWEKAINALKEVAYSPHSMAENAKWYLSLAYLRTGEIEKARDLLKEVAAPTDRAKKAKKIFRQLGL
ncbi:MAG: tetratricopeptide repeat protein, partial [Saprospiraceae bacterium]|nr:tetratricopeptide repeat protein [Saprospiraceae bacterium]